MYSPVGGNRGIHTYKGIHTIDFYIVCFFVFAINVNPYVLYGLFLAKLLFV